MFYQCFPYGVQWGRMHWGHAVSKDLVCWKHVGIAVFPSKYADKDGCFSGTAVEHNKGLYLFYTGVRYLKENPENINLSIDDQFVSSQMLIFSQNGCDFDNINHKREIIPSIEESSIGSARDTRDPKVWRGTDAWYMLLGKRINSLVRNMYRWIS